MKKLFLFLITSTLFLSCSNSKKTSEDKTESKPEASVPLAPGHIKAMLEITDIEENESQNIISAKVLEVLGYGSATEPVPEGSLIRFTVTTKLFTDSNDDFSEKSTINATLTRLQGRMMDNSDASTLWTLITINN